MRVAAAEQPLFGQTVLIMGASGGVGYQTARALARSGVRMIITGRDPCISEQAAAAICRKSGRDSVTFRAPTTPPSAATRTWRTVSVVRSPD